MANVIAGMIVTLGMDAAEYIQGLTKAEYQAQKFARNTRTAILEVAKVIGGLEIGRQLFENTKEIIGQAAALNDLSDATGSTVENLSRLTNQAKIAGTDFATLQTAVLKLSQGMAGADDESTKTKEALKILGITAKDPVEVLQQVALKLNTYADGVNKVGFAVALFGKNGAPMVATLKDIAELQDVGATVSKKQAEEAENLEKAFRRLSVEATTFKNIILTDLVPALTNAIQQFIEGTRVAGGFWNALLLFGTMNPFKTAGESIKDLTADLELLKKSNKGVFDGADPAIARYEKRLAFAKLLQRQEALALIDPSNNDRLDRLANKKPDAPNPPSSGGNKARALKDTISDAERYIESLEKQLQATLELNAVELAEVEIYLLKQKALGGLTSEREAQIRDYAAQINNAKDLKDAQEAQKKQEEEAARIRERNSKDTTRRIEDSQKEAQTIRDSNEQIQEQIAFLRGGEAGLRAYTDAKLAKAIAESMDKEAMLANAGASKEEIEAIHDITKALQERKAQLGQLDLAKQFAAEAKALQDVKNALSDAFANSFADFISGAKTAKEAIKSFADDVVKQVTRVATQNIGNAIFGGKNEGGPDFFGVIGKLLGFGGGDAAKGVAGAAGAASTTAAATALTGSATALAGSGLALDTSALGLGTAATGLGAAAAALTAAAAAMSVSSAASGVGDIFGSALSGLAAGGGLANGTNFARGGLTVVGERGPELIDLPRGARVTPMSEIGKAGNVYNINIATHVMPGATTASVRQTKQMVRDAVMSATRER